MPEQEAATSEKQKPNAPELMHTLKGEGFEIPLYETEIKRNESKKGVVYPAPTKKFVIENLPTVMKWLGEKRAASIIYSRIKQLMQGLYDEYADENTGELDLAKFEQAALNQLDTRGETKADLVEEKETLFIELSSDEMMEQLGQGNMARWTEIRERIKELNEAIEAKSRERKPKTELKGEAAAAPATA